MRLTTLPCGLKSLEGPRHGNGFRSGCTAQEAARRKHRKNQWASTQGNRQKKSRTWPEKVASDESHMDTF